MSNTVNNTSVNNTSVNGASNAPVFETLATLKKMSFPSLKRYATSHGIDINGMTYKSILAAIESGKKYGTRGNSNGSNRGPINHSAMDNFIRDVKALCDVTPDVSYSTDKTHGDSRIRIVVNDYSLFVLFTQVKHCNFAIRPDTITEYNAEYRIPFNTAPVAIPEKAFSYGAYKALLTGYDYTVTARTFFIELCELYGAEIDVTIRNSFLTAVIDDNTAVNSPVTSETDNNTNTPETDKTTANTADSKDNKTAAKDSKGTKGGAVKTKGGANSKDSKTAAKSKAAPTATGRKSK